MKADSQETAPLTVPMLYYIKALVLSLRLGIVVALWMQSGRREVFQIVFQYLAFV